MITVRISTTQESTVHSCPNEYEVISVMNMFPVSDVQFYYASDRKRMLKLYKTILDTCVSDFKTNPSANAYATLTSAMLFYQRLNKQTSLV